MAQINTTNTFFRLTQLTGNGLNYDMRAYNIVAAGAATDWGALATQGAPFTPVGGSGNTQWGTILGWTSANDSTNASVSCVWILNRNTQILTFMQGTATATTITPGTTNFWLCFCFDDSATNIAWTDTGWIVNLSNLGTGANTGGLWFLFGANFTWNSGSAQLGRGGASLSYAVNLQANAAFGNVPVSRGPSVAGLTAITTYNSTFNWYGVTIDGSLQRSEQYFVFPAGFSGTMRNTDFANLTASAAAPNLGFAGPNTMTIDGVTCGRQALCPGNPLLGATPAAVITNLITGSQTAFADREQPMGPFTPRDYVSIGTGTGLTNISWRASRLNVRTNATGRSLVPQIYRGMQYRSAVDNSVIVFPNFHATNAPRNTATPSVVAQPYHMYEYGWVSDAVTPAQNANNQGKYDVAWHIPYQLSVVNAAAAQLFNVYVSGTNGSTTDGTRTRFLPIYDITNATPPVMTRTFPTTATSPQAILITALNQIVEFAHLYLYGRNDTTSQVAAWASFTNDYQDSNSLAPTSPNTVDPTNVQLMFVDKWGYVLFTQLSTFNGPSLTIPRTVALIFDPYIKAVDDTPNVNTNRAAARSLNIAVTQANPMAAITAIAVNSAMDGNDVFGFLEAFRRDLGANSSGYLRPMQTYADPSILAGGLGFANTMTAFNVNAAITNWTPTATRAAINRIALSAGTVTFAAGTVAGTTMRFEAPTININSQVITNGDLIATTSITNLLTTGTIMNGSANVNFGTGPGSAITLTGNAFFTVTTGSISGTLTLTPGAAGRVVTFTGLTAGNSSTFNLVNANVGTVISLVGWIGTIPAGFQVLSNYSVTLPNTVGFNTNTVRVNKLFRNNAAGDIVTPILASTPNGITVSWSGNAADRFSYCGFVDTLTPIYFDKPASSLVSPAPIGGFAIDPANLDFTQRANFIAADTTFINGTGWTVGTNNITIMSPNAVYDKSASRPISKMVVRAMMENVNANPFHFGIATSATSNGVLLVNSILFNELGTASNTGWALLWAKSSSSNNVVVFNLWNVNELGVQRTISSLDVTTQIQFAGFSPGAVAELTGEDVAVIATASAEANLPAFNEIANRLNDLGIFTPPDDSPIT